MVPHLYEHKVEEEEELIQHKGPVANSTLPSTHASASAVTSIVQVNINANPNF